MEHIEIGDGMADKFMADDFDIGPEDGVCRPCDRSESAC